MKNNLSSDGAASANPSGSVSSEAENSSLARPARRTFLFLGIGAAAILALVLVLVLVAQPAAATGPAGTRALGSTDAGSPAATLAISPDTQIFTVEAQIDRDAVEVSGNLLPGRAEDHVSQVAAQILAVHVQPGQRVAAGDVLVQLDNAALLYELASLRFDLEQEELSGSPRRLELMRMQLDLKQQNLERYTIRAGMAGIVSTVDAEVGQNVATSAPLVRIIDTDWLRAEVAVDELDIPAIELGQDVEVELDALPELTLFGSVARIGSEGTPTGNGYSTVPVELSFRQADARVLPGFSFTGSVYVASQEEALVVDRRAVQSLNDQAGLVFVVSESGDNASPVPVSYESFGQLFYKIEGDIAAGARLIDAPERSLGQGGGFSGGAGFGGFGGGGPGPSMQMRIGR